MGDVLLNERAEAVLDELAGDAVDGAVPAGAVVRVIAGHAPNRGAELVPRLRAADAGPWDAPVRLADLRDRAGREAERLGAPRAGCEHLVLAVHELAAGATEAARARAELQSLNGELAFAGYAGLSPRSPRPAAPPVAVVFAGLPGSGKSTLAEEVGTALRAPVFSLDWQLGALTPFGLVRGDNAVPLGEHLITAGLGRQLQLGLDVVADTAGHLSQSRDRLRSLAGGLGAGFVGVETVCPDEEVHRARVDGRSRGIPGWPGTVTWDHVLRMRSRWQEWTEPHLVLDTTTPLSDCVAQVLAEVDKAR